MKARRRSRAPLTVKPLRAVAASLAVIVLFAGLSPAGSVSGNPVIVTGFKDGPVILTNDYQTLGRQELARGSWFITARFFAFNGDTTIPTVHDVDCVFGTNDIADGVDVFTAGDSAFDHLPVTLTEAIHLGSGGGAVRLRCRTTDAGGEVSINLSR